MDPDPYSFLYCLLTNQQIAFQHVFILLLAALEILSLSTLFLLVMFEKSLIKINSEEIRILKKGQPKTLERLQGILEQNQNLSTTLSVCKFFLIIIISASSYFFIQMNGIYLVIIIAIIAGLIGFISWLLPFFVSKNNLFWIRTGIAFLNGFIIRFVPFSNKYAPQQPKLPEDDVSLEELKNALPEVDNQSPNTANLVLYKQVLRFNKIIIKNVMRPKSEIIGLKANYNMREVLEKIEVSQFSRFPVIDDSWKNILGIIHCKDLLPFTHLSTYDWKQHLRPITYVRETDSAHIILRAFQNSKSHMALVRNNEGMLTGIVTLEDITEEIIGEIEDE